MEYSQPNKDNESTDLCEPKYNMTCEAGYFWDSRGAHFRVDTTIKMEYAQPNKDKDSADLFEPKYNTTYECFRKTSKLKFTVSLD